MELEFKVGGPVNYLSSVYVERKIEKKIFRAIQRRQFVTIVGSRQVGKTSLLQKIHAIATQQGHATVLIDMSTINPNDITFDRWSKNFTNLLNNNLKGFNNQLIKSPINSGQFIDFWEQLASKINKNNILILMDEASSVPENVRDAFYSTIRWIFTDRTAYNSSRHLRKLNFVFAGVFQPERLIKNKENSPFNISKIFRLPDFKKRESLQFFQLIEKELNIEIPDIVVDKIFINTKGHPYYLQSMASVLLEELQDYPKLRLNKKTIEYIIEEGIENISDNINHIGKTVLDYRKQFYLNNQGVSFSQKFVIDALIEEEDVPFTRALSQISKLELFGVITKNENNCCVFRNIIIGNTFHILISPMLNHAPNLVIKDTPKPSPNELISKIKDLIGKNKLESAIELMESRLLEKIEDVLYGVKSLKNEILQIKRRYKKIKEDSNRGVLAHDQVSLELNKICRSLIDLLDSLM